MPGSTTASQEIAAFCAAFTSSEYFNLSPGRALIWDLTPRTRRLICDLQTPRSSAHLKTSLLGMGRRPFGFGSLWGSMLVHFGVHFELPNRSKNGTENKLIFKRFCWPPRKS